MLHDLWRWFIHEDWWGIAWNYFLRPAIEFTIGYAIFRPTWFHFTKKQPVKAAMIEHYTEHHAAPNPYVCEEKPCDLIPDYKKSQTPSGAVAG